MGKITGLIPSSERAPTFVEEPAPPVDNIIQPEVPEDEGPEQVKPKKPARTKNR